MHIYCNSMVIKSSLVFVCFLLVCAVLWGIHIDNSIGTEGLAGLYVQGNMPII